jgi:hypothetical protein
MSAASPKWESQVMVFGNLDRGPDPGGSVREVCDLKSLSLKEVVSRIVRVVYASLVFYRLLVPRTRPPLYTSLDSCQVLAERCRLGGILSDGTDGSGPKSVP